MKNIYIEETRRVGAGCLHVGCMRPSIGEDHWHQSAPFSSFTTDSAALRTIKPQRSGARNGRILVLRIDVGELLKFDGSQMCRFNALQAPATKSEDRRRVHVRTKDSDDPMSDVMNATVRSKFQILCCTRTGKVSRKYEIALCFWTRGPVVMSMPCPMPSIALLRS